MFRRDPIDIALGKDVARLIHRIIHRNLLNELNAEYHRRVKHNREGTIQFDNLAYNWRTLHSKPLCVFFQIHNLKKTVARLPKNY